MHTTERHSHGQRQARRRIGESPDDLIKTFPLDTRWQRNLLGRLDAVAVINRMARGAAAGWGPGFTWRYVTRVLSVLASMPFLTVAELAEADRAARALDGAGHTLSVD